MLRRPTGIIILLLALFGLTTIAGGLAGGQWGFEHVRGRSMLPLAGVALILLAIAGDRRWITAVTTEGAAIISAVWGLNYARLLLKWGGDASATDLVITAVLGLGCIAASVLFIRARPQTTPEDWFRGSAICGAGLWIVGLRHGPGSRAGLGLAALMLSTALLVGMFETVQRAPAIGRSLLEVMDDPQLRTIRGWDGTIPGVASPPASPAPAPPSTIATAGEETDLDPLGIFGVIRRAEETGDIAESTAVPAEPAEAVETSRATTGGIPPRTGIPMPNRVPMPPRPTPTPGAERIEPAPASPEIPSPRQGRAVTPSRHRS